jgi:hypothetical protein
MTSLRLTAQPAQTKHPHNSVVHPPRPPPPAPEPLRSDAPATPCRRAPAPPQPRGPRAPAPTPRPQRDRRPDIAPQPPPATGPEARHRPATGPEARHPPQPRPRTRTRAPHPRNPRTRAAAPACGNVTLWAAQWCGRIRQTGHPDADGGGGSMIWVAGPQIERLGYPDHESERPDWNKPRGPAPGRPDAAGLGRSDRPRDTPRQGLVPGALCARRPRRVARRPPCPGPGGTGETTQNRYKSLNRINTTEHLQWRGVVTRLPSPRAHPGR